MTTLFSFMLQSSIIVALFYMYYYFVLRQNTFYKTNRSILLASLALALIIPGIRIPLWASAGTPAEEGMVTVLLGEIQVLGQTGIEQLSNTTLILWCYLSGLIFFGCRFLFSLLSLLRLRLSYPGTVQEGVRYVIVPQKYPVSSFFHTVFINQELLNSPERLKIITHEKMHIRQLHSLDLLAVELFCIFNWFNPFAWLLKDAIRQNHEYLADKAVLRQHNLQEYLELLLAQTCRISLAFTHPFASSNLKKRIIMMTKQQTSARRVINYFPVLLLCMAVFFVFSCENKEAKTSPEEIKAVETTNTFDYSKTKVSDEDDVFVIAEQMPTFPEGDITKWLAKNMTYPPIAEQCGIQGKVFVKFVVEKDGSVSNVEIVRGVDPSLDKEALRVVSSMPKWNPGKQKDKAVRISFTVPINFSLPKE